MSSVSSTKKSARNQAPAQAPAADAAPQGADSSSLFLHFDRVEAEAKALPVSELRAVDTDVYVVASGVTLRLSKLLDLRPRFAHHEFPLEPFDNLGVYAAVASDAYVAHQPLAHEATESALLFEASVPILKRFKGEAAFLVMRGKAKAEEFETLEERKSFRNNSEGITRYGRVLLRELPYLIECKSTITEQEIEEAMEIARRLGEIVGEREAPGHVKGKSHAPDDMMTRTFTLFDKAMDSVRAGLNYIFQDTPEKVEEYLPRKVKKPSTTPKKKKTVPVAKPPEGEQKPDAKNGGTPSANGNVQSPTPSANGNVQSPTPSANGNVQSPTPSANGNVRAPEVRNEDRAAE